MIFNKDFKLTLNIALTKIDVVYKKLSVMFLSIFTVNMYLISVKQNFGIYKL